MKHLLHIWMSCLLLVVTTACEKDTLASIFAPEVTTGTATDIYRKGATLSGSIQLSEGMVAERYGILFSTLSGMEECEELEITDGSTDFSISVQNLVPGKTYYFCSFVHSGYSIHRGEVRDFTTTRSNAPIFEMPVASLQTMDGFTVSVDLLDDGGSELLMVGFCYNELGEKEPTFLDDVINVEPGGNSYSAEFTGLEPGKTYQVRVYGASENGLAYSEMLVVSTQQAAVPYLSTISCKDSTATSISVTASVIDAGISPIKEVGFCYKAEGQENEIVIDLSDQLGNEHFSTIIEGLSVGTIYTIRAYAKNEEGIGYSSEVNYAPIFNPGIYSLEDWSEFCFAKNNGLTDLSKWKNSEGIINLYTDLDFSDINLVNNSFNYGRYLLSEICENEILDGNNHVISGFFLEVGDLSQTLIWSNKGTIKNLHLGEGEVIGGAYMSNPVAAFCLFNFGQIVDCSSKIMVQGHNTTAAFCPDNRGSIIRCINWGDVYAGYYSDAAGIAIGGTITDCKNYGNITGNHAAGIGGTFVANSINYGMVGFNPNDENSSYPIHAAGISISASVEGCVNEGRVHASECSGGIVAYLSDELKVNDCNNKGDITGEGYCGGIIGLIKKTSVFYIAGGFNTNRGTVNSAVGDETNAIGYDERTGNTLIDDLPTIEWEYAN